MPQDRILQTAKQMADHLNKRAAAGWKKKQREGCWNDRCAVGRITAENDEKQLKLMVDECAAKVANVLQKKVKTGGEPEGYGGGMCCKGCGRTAEDDGL